MILFWLAALVKVTLANATWPPGAIWWEVSGVKGETTLATSGLAATLSNTFLARATTAGSVTLPWSTPITSWSVSPDWWGLAFCSSRMASKLPVWGSLKLSVNALPAAEWMATSATRPTNQPSSASHLCLKHQEARVLIRQSIPPKL